jgi:hypothetical protein
MASSNIKSASELSHNGFLDVPPELCAIIAYFASRQSLASLCSVSRRLCSIFSAPLYANTVDPPLTSAQSSCLIKTLSTAKTLSWKPHPALFIRQLGLTDSGLVNDIKAKAKTSADSLRNIYRLIPDFERSRGSALRSLHWNIAAGLDELGQILGAPGHFPNLRELMVSCNGTNSNFGVSAVYSLR